MDDQFVFELTVEVTTDVEVFYEPLEFLPPTEMVVSEEPSPAPEEQIAAYEEYIAQIQTDPEMIAWYAWNAAMQAYCAAPTLEEQLAIVATFQGEVFS